MKKKIKKLLLGWGGISAIMFVFMATIVGNTDTNMNVEVQALCVAEEKNYEMWESAIARSGVFATYGDVFVRLAEYYEIDPVLFAAIVMHGTRWGTRGMVLNSNNPNSSMGDDLVETGTLEDELRVIAQIIAYHINEREATTLTVLRDIFPTPVADDDSDAECDPDADYDYDVDCDPTPPDIIWLISMALTINQFGGLTMNCEVDEGEFGMPIDDPIVVTSPFGIRRDPFGSGYEMHIGIDFGQPMGSPIRASLDGVVVYINYSDIGYGNQIIIEHDDEWWTQYAHLEEILVEVGDEVIQGELIATMGSTGNSTGPHLHFEIRRSKFGDQLDPAPLLGIR